MTDSKPRHPLPESGEARHDEIPETAEAEKGTGEDGAELIQPDPVAVNPDGTSYDPSGELDPAIQQ